MRLNEAADRLFNYLNKTKGKIPDAIEWLYDHDDIYELRRRGKRRDHKLRLRPDGSRFNDCYLPHIPIDAQVYARTWKALNSLKKNLGRTTTSEVWEHDILPMIENVVRKTKEVK
jgi:hypothetical protein